MGTLVLSVESLPSQEEIWTTSAEAMPAASIPHILQFPDGCALSLTLYDSLKDTNMTKLQVHCFMG